MATTSSAKRIATVSVILVVLIAAVIIGTRSVTFQKKSDKSNVRIDAGAIKTKSTGKWSTIEVSDGQSETFRKFTIQYPTTWKIQKDPSAGVRFILSKDGTTLTAIQPPGSIDCLFPDTDMAKVDPMWKKNSVYTDYKELIAGPVKLRRIKIETGPGENNKRIYMVCEQSAPGEIFKIPGKFGAMNITTSTNVSDDVLSEIDTILSTLRY
jgi:hypothetical protein